MVLQLRLHAIALPLKKFIEMHYRCRNGQCLPLCDINVLKKNGLEVTEHLESNPNIPKPSCDDAFIDKLDLPISSSRVYVPAGDMVKISCDTKHRLVVNVTHHVNVKNCYGDFLDLVCFKIGSHVAEWRILSNPLNNKIPTCAAECENNR